MTDYSTRPHGDTAGIVRDIVERMNRTFCVVIDDRGQFKVLMRDGDRVVPLSRTAFLRYHEDQLVRLPGCVDWARAADIWLRSPLRRKHPSMDAFRAAEREAGRPVASSGRRP